MEKEYDKAVREFKELLDWEIERWDEENMYSDSTYIEIRVDIKKIKNEQLQIQQKES